MFQSLKLPEEKERRWKHAAVAVGGAMFSFGGVQKGKEGAVMDVRILDTLASSWKEPKASASGSSAPSRRSWHTAVLIGNTVYLWGGFKADSLDWCNELYAFDVDEHTWSVPAKQKGYLPKAMEGHSACALGNVMYIYGLHTRVGFRDKFSSGMYKLDTASMVWSSLSPEGGERLSVYHSATVIGTRMFVFGGRPTESRMVYDEDLNADDDDDDSWGHFDDIREFDTTTDRWLQPTAAGSGPGDTPRPKGREGHSAFAHDGELYIFGGSGACQITSLNDLWRFDPRDSSWHELPRKGQTPSRRHGMCSCTMGSRVVLSGGDGSKRGINLGPEEVYILDL